MFAIRLPIVETEEFFEYREAHCSGMMVGIIPHRRDPTFSDMLSYFYFTAALQKKKIKKMLCFSATLGIWLLVFIMVKFSLPPLLFSFLMTTHLSRIFRLI